MQVNCIFFNIYLFVFLIYLYTEYSDFIGIFTAFNMGQNGGARPGAGRKPKIQEIKLIEQMDAISVPEEIWKALLFKCQEGDTAAIKLWLSYRFGLPKQQIDVTTNGENIAPPIQWISKNIAIESAKVISEEEEEAQQIESLGTDPKTAQTLPDPQKEKLFI